MALSNGFLKLNSSNHPTVTTLRPGVGAILQKWVPYSQRYLFNTIPDTNHNANPTNPNRYSKGNPTNPNTRYRCE